MTFSNVVSGANFGCGTDLRKSLIKNWRNLFTTACPGGSAHCPAGLTHAWRRPDVSGTTDAFQGVLRVAQERKVHMRTAAYLLAVDRVARSTTTRGIYP